jgi:hypothetical protein
MEVFQNFEKRVKNRQKRVILRVFHENKGFSGSQKGFKNDQKVRFFRISKKGSKSEILRGFRQKSSPFSSQKDLEGFQSCENTPPLLGGYFRGFRGVPFYFR